MVAVMAESAPEALEALIRNWAYARLNTDAPGWPALGFLGLIIELGPFASAIGRRRKGSQPPPSGKVARVNRRDAIMVQKVVDTMPEELRGPFEAWYLGIIRGDNCRGLPHAARAATLGLRRTTYYERVK